MTNRLDALMVKERDGKSYWTKIGVAFASKDGKGFSVLLDAVPAASAEGQVKIMLREPDAGGNTGNRAQTRSSDDIPY